MTEKETKATEEKAPKAKKNDVMHKIVKGDTLWSIASENGLTISDLRRLNDDKLDGLSVGKEINLGPAKVYVVKEGDTLQDIGGRLGIQWQALAAKNKMEPPYEFKVGDEIKY